ncbi:hypothetical protein D3C76_1456470 [compost metagenome]
MQVALAPVLHGLGDFLLVVADEVPPHEDLFLHGFAAEQQRTGGPGAFDLYILQAAPQISHFVAGKSFPVHLQGTLQYQHAILEGRVE